jgi:hypothetical protein
MQIVYPDGSVRRAWILTLNGATMRIAIEGFDDAAELRLVNNQWMTDAGEPVTFEFPLESMGGAIPPTRAA